MCTAIVEITRVDGSAKRAASAGGWFALSHAMVSYDHPTHAPLEDAILVDFVDRESAPSARVAVELTLESAKALREALDRAIAAAEAEEADHRSQRLPIAAE